MLVCLLGFVERIREVKRNRVAFYSCAKIRVNSVTVSNSIIKTRRSRATDHWTVAIYIRIHSKHSVYPSCVYLSICFECREMFVSRKEEICSRDCSLYHFYVATRTKRHERIRSAIEAYVRSNVRKVKICYRRSECRRRNVVEQSCTMVDSSTTGESSLSELDRLGRSDLGYPAIRLPVPLFFPFHLLRLVVIRQPNSRHTPPVSFHPPRATLPVLLSFKSNSRRGSNDRPTDFTAWNFGVPTTFPSSFSAFLFFFFRALCSSLFDWTCFFFFFSNFWNYDEIWNFFFLSSLFSSIQFSSTKKEIHDRSRHEEEDHQPCSRRNSHVNVTWGSKLARKARRGKFPARSVFYCQVSLHHRHE